MSTHPSVPYLDRIGLSLEVLPLGDTRDNTWNSLIGGRCSARQDLRQRLARLTAGLRVRVYAVPTLSEVPSSASVSISVLADPSGHGDCSAWTTT